MTLCKVLEQLAEPLERLLSGRPLRVKLQGLVAMNEDPSAIHVLYFDIHDTEDANGAEHAGLEELCELAEIVASAFRSKGLLTASQDRSAFQLCSCIPTSFLSA